MSEELKPFKAIIRVVKSIKNEYRDSFGSVNILKDLVFAKDKKEVKKIMLEKYPQFFQNGKIYEKESKDQAQFFYVLIYPLYNYEIENLNSGEWVCDGCGQKHENKYISPPKHYGQDSKLNFCRPNDDIYSSNDKCLDLYMNKGVGEDNQSELLHERSISRIFSEIYIYKITEKSTGKCYIGQTRNPPFFRWWNHLKHSRSPFGLYFKKSKLENWSFEVLETMPENTINKDALMRESEYILKYDSINNGFNTLISNKNATNQDESIDDEEIINEDKFIDDVSQEK